MRPSVLAGHRRCPAAQQPPADLSFHDLAGVSAVTPGGNRRRVCFAGVGGGNSWRDAGWPRQHVGVWVPKAPEVIPSIELGLSVPGREIQTSCRCATGTLVGFGTPEQ